MRFEPIDVRVFTDEEAARAHDLAVGSGRSVAFVAAIVDGIIEDLVLTEQREEGSN